MSGIPSGFSSSQVIPAAPTQVPDAASGSASFAGREVTAGHAHPTDSPASPPDSKADAKHLASREVARADPAHSSLMAQIAAYPPGGRLKHEAQWRAICQSVLDAGSMKALETFIARAFPNAPDQPGQIRVQPDELGRLGGCLASQARSLDSAVSCFITLLEQAGIRGDGAYPPELLRPFIERISTSGPSDIAQCSLAGALFCPGRDNRELITAIDKAARGMNPSALKRFAVNLNGFLNEGPVQRALLGWARQDPVGALVYGLRDIDLLDPGTPGQVLSSLATGCPDSHQALTLATMLAFSPASHDPACLLTKESVPAALHPAYEKAQAWLAKPESILTDPAAQGLSLPARYLFLALAARAEPSWLPRAEFPAAHAGWKPELLAHAMSFPAPGWLALGQYGPQLHTLVLERILDQEAGQQDGKREVRAPRAGLPEGMPSAMEKASAQGLQGEYAHTLDAPGGLTPERLLNLQKITSDVQQHPMRAQSAVLQALSADLAGHRAHLQAALQDKDLREELLRQDLTSWDLYALGLAWSGREMSPEMAQAFERDAYLPGSLDNRGTLGPMSDPAVLEQMFNDFDRLGLRDNIVNADTLQDGPGPGIPAPLHQAASDLVDALQSGQPVPLARLGELVTTFMGTPPGGALDTDALRMAWLQALSKRSPPEHAQQLLSLLKQPGTFAQVCESMSLYLGFAQAAAPASALARAPERK